MSLWASSDLARAYADVRSDFSPELRTVWGDAVRAAAPPGRLDRLLDVGCGTGRFTALLAHVFARPALGIDGSPAMLAERVTAPALMFATGDATAIPLRASAIDLALLSMVYHLLATAGVAAAAATELHRVIRAGGRMLVRTPSLELIDTIHWLPFFPGARALDEARLPARSQIVLTFRHAGFALHAHRTIEQTFASSPEDALAKLRRRPFSTLRLLPDDAFTEGLARYEAYCRTTPPTPPSESLDFFVFTRV
jgi:SAM-dependent methyltransferase